MELEETSRTKSVKAPSESADSGFYCSSGAGGQQQQQQQQLSRVASIENIDLPGPPDGGWGWVICFACFGCNFVLDGIAYSFGVMLETLVNHFDSSRASVSWVGSLLTGVYMLSGPIVGGIVNKYGIRVACFAGSLISAFGIGLSVFSPNVPVLMLTYGVIGGFGIGLIYLPAVVACGYYFERRRALATGISVCGSGVGCIAFAPLANFLLEEYGWQGAHIIFAGLCLNCVVFAGLMRPLEIAVEPNDRRVNESRRGSYITVLPANSGGNTECLVPEFKIETADDDVFLEEEEEDLSESSQTYTRNQFLSPQMGNKTEESGSGVAEALKLPTFKPRQIIPASVHRHLRIRTFSESPYVHSNSFSTPRFEDPPGMMNESLFINKRNISTPGFGNMGRVNSTTDHGELINYFALGVNGESRVFLQPHSQGGSRIFVRPMARKDVFYTRSIHHLSTFGLDDHDMTQPRVVLQRSEAIIGSHLSIQQAELDPDPGLIDENETRSNPLWSALKEMLDLALLKNPLFLLICLSNIFGFLALYVPYMYLPNMAAGSGISTDKSSYIISIIGISNTIGRLITGAFVDLPCVSSLVVTNMSLILSGVSVISFPFCQSYTAFVVVASLLGLFLSAYVSLTSIVLVDLIGLDSLTSSFGLLVLVRGFGSIVGPPLAGALYDVTGRYDTSFFTAGAMLILAGMISAMADIFQRRRKFSN